MKKGFDIFAVLLILGSILFALGRFIPLPAHDPVGISLILCAFIVGFLAAGCGLVGVIVTGICILIRKKYNLPDSTETALFCFSGICGIISLAVGVYFWFFVGGLPYQDPTEDMLSHWAFAHKLGDIFGLCGIIALVGGIVGELVLIYCKKRRN